MKLEFPKVLKFIEFIPKLAGSAYGSEKYNELLKKMNVELQYYYANNRRFPEYFEKCIY